MVAGDPAVEDAVGVVDLAVAQEVDDGGDHAHQCPALGASARHREPVRRAGTGGQASRSALHASAPAAIASPSARTCAGGGRAARGRGAAAPATLTARRVTGKAVLDGVRLDTSAQRTTSVDHVDQHGAGGAYVSASTVSGDLTVSRG